MLVSLALYKPLKLIFNLFFIYFIFGGCLFLTEIKKMDSNSRSGSTNSKNNNGNNLATTFIPMTESHSCGISNHSNSTNSHSGSVNTGNHHDDDAQLHDPRHNDLQPHPFTHLGAQETAILLDDDRDDRDEEERTATRLNGVDDPLHSRYGNRSHVSPDSRHKSVVNGVGVTVGACCSKREDEEEKAAQGPRKASLKAGPDADAAAAKRAEAGVEEDGEEGGDSDSEDESHEERLQNSAYVNKLVLMTQVYVTRFCHAVNSRFKGHLVVILCLLLFAAYFIYAMYYRFGDEGSVRLLWCTLLATIIATRHQVLRLFARTQVGQWCSSEKSPAAIKRINTARFFIRWLLYGGGGAFVAYVIVDVGIHDTSKLKSLPGLFGFLILCFVFSSSPSKVNWHTVYWSVVLQFILAVLVMRWQGGKDAVLWIQDRLDEFFANSKYASKMIFGDSYMEHYMIFGALPIVFLTNATLSMLYYLGAIQFLIKVIGDSLQFVLSTSPIESTGVAASIFMEGASAFLVLRPYLKDLTHSQLFCLVTACMASIGGAYLAILAQMGFAVEFMLPAMVISCPATFAVCKLMAPDTRKVKKINVDAELPKEMRYSNILEAIQTGAISVISLVANVVVSAYAFLCMITWANNTFTWFGDRVGIYQLTIEKILSYLFYPFALLMGVELDDCRNVAMLMGYRITTSSFLALLKMRELTTNRAILQRHIMTSNVTYFYKGDNIIIPQLNLTLVDGVISRRSEAISTYALCGFSGLMSLFICIGILISLIPHRRKWLSQQAIPILIAGNFANFMVGNFAGLLV